MKGIFALAFLFITTSVPAQKVKLKEGNLAAIKAETAFNFEFVYADMVVGKFKSEAEYLDKKREDLNKKKAGKGDEWVNAWKADQTRYFEPSFKEQFLKVAKSKEDKSAKYTIIFNTTLLNPGANVVVAGTDPYLNGEAVIVETANNKNVVAVLTVFGAFGGQKGFEYGKASEISVCYAKAGKALAKFIW